MNSSRESSDDATLHPRVFWGSSALIALICGITLAARERVAAVTSRVQELIVQDLGWFYVAAMTGYVCFAVWLAQSRFGAIRLGGDDEKPEFSRLTWFAMLFSAGMGIGLLFFGVAEPILHLAGAPTPQADELEAARTAMALTFFHWGLHPWAIYAIVGGALAYFCYRHGMPMAIRSTLYPLLGDRVHGRVGDLVDTLAVVGTLFGVATSLGLGAAQVNAGLNRVFGLPVASSSQLLIIVAFTLMATVSVISGVGRGIRRLSEFNMTLAAGLLIWVAITGPTAFLCNAFVENLGAYLEYLPRHSFWTGSFADARGKAWLGSWTVFYWAWWISWAPFVGVFIARISRGRTLREFFAGTLLAPPLVGFVWLTVFGGTALHIEILGSGGLSAAVDQSIPTAIFELLDRLPGAGWTAIICTVCIALFFVTSSDSASLVIDLIASGGHPDPPVRQRVYWACVEGIVAAVLLAWGGLRALQTAAITTALPFGLIAVCICVAWVRALNSEMETGHASPRPKGPSKNNLVSSARTRLRWQGAKRELA